jgi:hypothetical protein
MEELYKAKNSLNLTIEEEVNKCFKGLDLDYAPGLGYKIYYPECIYCDPIPDYVYIYVLEMQLDDKTKNDLFKEIGAPDSPNDPDDPESPVYEDYRQGIDNYMFGRLIDSNRSNKSNNCAAFGLFESTITKEKQESLAKGLVNLWSLFEGIERSGYINQGKEIVNKVIELRIERDRIINELKEALLYPSFPKDCEYLSKSSDRK